MDAATSTEKPVIQTRLTVEHWDWGFGLGFDFCNTEGKPDRKWWGVVFRNDDTPETVAERLEELAHAIRENLCCRHGEEYRTRFEVNAADFEREERVWPERERP